MLLYQFISVLANVVEARDQLTLLDVVKGEQVVMAVTPVVHTEVDAGLIGRGSHHQLHHQFRDIDPFLELPLGIVLLIIVSLTTTDTSVLPILSPLGVTGTSLVVTTRIFHHHIIPSTGDKTSCCFNVLNLVKVLSDPILSSIFILCLP